MIDRAIDYRLGREESANLLGSSRNSSDYVPAPAAKTQSGGKLCPFPVKVHHEARLSLLLVRESEASRMVRAGSATHLNRRNNKLTQR